MPSTGRERVGAVHDLRKDVVDQRADPFEAGIVGRVPDEGVPELPERRRAGDASGRGGWIDGSESLKVPIAQRVLLGLICRTHVCYKIAPMFHLPWVSCRTTR